MEPLLFWNILGNSRFLCYTPTSVHLALSLRTSDPADHWVLRFVGSGDGLAGSHRQALPPLPGWTLGQPHPLKGYFSVWKMKTPIHFFFLSFFRFSEVLGVEPRAPCMLGKCSPSVLQPLPGGPDSDLRKWLHKHEQHHRSAPRGS